MNPKQNFREKILYLIKTYEHIASKQTRQIPSREQEHLPKSDFPETKKKHQESLGPPNHEKCRVLSPKLYGSTWLPMVGCELNPEMKFGMVILHNPRSICNCPHVFFVMLLHMGT